MILVNLIGTAPCGVVAWLGAEHRFPLSPWGINERVDRTTLGESPKPKVTELAEASGERRVKGDRKLQSKEVSQGTQEALGLADREVEYPADRKRSLDGQV